MDPTSIHLSFKWTVTGWTGSSVTQPDPGYPILVGQEQCYQQPLIHNAALEPGCDQPNIKVIKKAWCQADVKALFGFCIE